MPVPAALSRLSEDPDFWSGLLTDSPADVGVAAGDLPAELRLGLPVAGGYGLVLDLDLVTGEQTVGLREPPTSEPVPLGSAVPGHAPPAALRWSELDLCGRVVALDDPDLPHPGLVVALLARFAPVTADDDATAAAAMLRAAYRSLRRPVSPVPPARPHQAPLPLFTDERWWPQPPSPSGQVLSEQAIAALATPAPARVEVRRTARFPRAGLAELVRHAELRLAAVPHQPGHADAGPLARHIAATGDLRPLGTLLAVLTESGCDHPTVLDALSEPVVTAEACWVVEALAGVARGTLLRRHLLGAAH